MIAEVVRQPGDKRKPSGLAFACVLKELRQMYRLEVRGAAEQAGISRRRWTKYEKGLYTPLTSQLTEIAVAFNIDPGWLRRRFAQYREQFSKDLQS